MEQESNSKDFERGQPRELIPGEAWSVGNFEVFAAGGMAAGCQLIGETEDGRSVTFNLMPQEVKALGSLIRMHESEVQEGVERFGDIDKGPTPPVFVDSSGGPEPIPTNRSAQARRHAEGAYMAHMTEEG